LTQWEGVDISQIHECHTVLGSIVESTQAWYEIREAGKCAFGVYAVFAGKQFCEMAGKRRAGHNMVNVLSNYFVEKMTPFEEIGLLREHICKNRSKNGDSEVVASPTDASTMTSQTKKKDFETFPWDMRFISFDAYLKNHEFEQLVIKDDEFKLLN